MAKNKTADRLGRDYILCEKSPFSVQEAYKQLRTNIIFSTAGEGCKIVAITSSIQHEAKSLTACNLAITFAQNNNKVLLIDADLRLPTDAIKLGVQADKGLSDVLVGEADLEDCIHHTGLDLLPAGTIPPNPTELLGSEKMRKLLETLSEKYEYILIDTPPVNTVVDAAIVSKFCTGVVLVCRQKFATTDSINNAIQSLDLADARILGFVYTGETHAHKRYGYGKYGQYGQYGYGYGYDNADHRNKKK